MTKPNYRDIMKALIDAGYQSYVVGGAVRDAYLERPISDYDIVTDATPDEVLALFEAAVFINATFSVSVYVPSSEEGGVVEVTTMRTEDDRDYVNGKPATFSFTTNIEEDLARRDMTIGAMAVTYEGELIDPFGGREHLKDRRIVAVGNPKDRIIAHPIRMLRYARMATTLGEIFTMDPPLVAAIIKDRKHLVKESWEAIGREFMKGLVGPSKYVQTLKHLGLLEIILPEVYRLKGVRQNKHHNFTDVWLHTLASLTYAGDNGYTALEKLAVLLHDIGKPDTAKFKNESYGYTFYKHAFVGEGIADQICKRLRLTNDERLLVTLAVRYHMYNITNHRSAKRFLGKMDIGGNTSAGELKGRAQFVLRVIDADAHSFGRDKKRRERARLAERLVSESIASLDAISTRMLAVNGHDIMEALEIEPGVLVGTLLKGLLETVISGSVANEKGALLDEAKRICGSIGTSVAAGV